MSLSIEQGEEPALLQLRGSLDIYEAESAAKAFRMHLATSAALALDVSGVLSCDAAGAQVLCAAKRSTLEAGRSFVIRRHSPAVAACFARLGLAPQL